MVVYVDPARGFRQPASNSPMRSQTTNGARSSKELEKKRFLGREMQRTSEEHIVNGAEWRASYPPPFSIPLLDAADASGLPASSRTDSHGLAAPSRDVITYIEKELDLERLNRIFAWLWIAGRPMPPRPLHHQLLLGREIFVTEQMDMHLVWTTG
ncbi:hypothetical protein DL767_010167 [Monosporascus sp. MG133]|nr:hypothetical protein DL767_010167 [Monosporascus sp. MG133]